MRDSLFQLEQEIQRMKQQAQQGLSVAQSYDDSLQTNRLLALEQSLILPKQIANSEKVNSWNPQREVVMQMGGEITVPPQVYMGETLKEYQRWKRIHPSRWNEFTSYFNEHVLSCYKEHENDEEIFTLYEHYLSRLDTLKKGNCDWKEVFLWLQILVERLNVLETPETEQSQSTRQRVFFEDIWLEIEHPEIKLSLIKDEGVQDQLTAKQQPWLPHLYGKHRVIRWKFTISCTVRCLSSEFFAPDGWQVGFIQNVRSHRWACFERTVQGTGRKMPAEKRLVRCDEDRWFLDTTVAADHPGHPFFKGEVWAAPKNLQDLTVTMIDQPSWALPYQYKPEPTKPGSA